MPITITTPCKPGEKTPSVTYSQRKFQPPVYTPSKNTRSPTVLSSQSSLESSLPSSLESLQRPGSYSRNNPTPSPQSVGTPAASQEAEEDIINDLDDDLDDLHVDYPVTGGPSWPPQTPVRRSIASPAPERGTAPRRRDEDDDDVGEDLDFLTRLMKQHQAMKGLTTPPPARRSVVASSRPPSVAPSTSSFRTPFSRNSMPPPLLPPPSSVLRTPLPRATPRAETPLDIDANLDNLVTPLPTTFLPIRTPYGRQPSASSSTAASGIGDNSHRTKALTFLESLAKDFLGQTANAVSADAWRALSHPQRGPGSNRDLPGIELRLTNRSTGQPQIISFPDEPGTQPSQPAMIRITRILCVAVVLYEAILTNGTVTMRDVYYRNVHLFGQQRVVDSIVDDLVATAGLKREDFHVCASAKGLVASDCLFVTLTTGEDLPLSATNAALIPPRQRIANISAPNGIDWILVVEKDAIMQSLCGLKLLEDERLGPGVVITGKGYPDLATLQFLRLIADKFPRVPIYALVDADPHGIDILSVYTHGSRANAHSADHAGLGLGDRLRWMGLKATDLWRFGGYDELIALGEKDIQLAHNMISRTNLPAEWRRELVHMLHLRRKAEIQILSGPAAGADEIAQSLAGLSSQQAQRSRLIEYIVAHLRDDARARRVHL